MRCFQALSLDDGIPRGRGGKQNKSTSTRESSQHTPSKRALISTYFEIMVFKSPSCRFDCELEPGTSHTRLIGTPATNCQHFWQTQSRSILRNYCSKTILQLLHQEKSLYIRSIALPSLIISFILTLRVQVPKYEVSTPSQNYGS